MFFYFNLYSRNLVQISETHTNQHATRMCLSSTCLDWSWIFGSMTTATWQRNQSCSRRITVPRQLPPSYLCTPCNAMQCLFGFASVLPRKSKFLLQNEALLRSFNPEAYEKAMNSAETGPAFQNRVLGSAGGCTLEMSDEELVCLHIYKRFMLGSCSKLMQIAKMPRIMQLLLLIWHVFCVFGPLVNAYIGLQSKMVPRIEILKTSWNTGWCVLPNGEVNLNTVIKGFILHRKCSCQVLLIFDNIIVLAFVWAITLSDQLAFHLWYWFTSMLDTPKPPKLLRSSRVNLRSLDVFLTFHVSPPWFLSSKMSSQSDLGWPHLFGTPALKW